MKWRLKEISLRHLPAVRLVDWLLRKPHNASASVCISLSSDYILWKSAFPFEACIGFGASEP